MPANILVVEDEPAIQELLALNLEHAGHHVLRARDAEHAAELVRHALPDLILLDWMLPGQSGATFARSLRQDDRTKQVLARIKAVLRRRAPELTDEPIEISGLRLDPATHRVTGRGAQVELGPTEFRLLHFLMAHPERVHSRAHVLDQVWGDHVFVEERTVDVHIRRLRKALEPTGHDRLIETVRGSGYRLAAN